MSAVTSGTHSSIGRGGITAASVQTANAFLASRWRAAEAASNNTSVAAAERPEVYREKPAASPASNVNTVSTGKQGGNPNTAQQRNTNSPWSSGRRH